MTVLWQVLGSPVNLGSWSKDCRRGGAQLLSLWRYGGETWVVCWGALDDLQGVSTLWPPDINLALGTLLKLPARISTKNTCVQFLTSWLNIIPFAISSVSFVKEPGLLMHIFFWAVSFFPCFFQGLSLLRYKKTLLSFSSTVSFSLLAFLKFQLSLYNPDAFCCICVSPVLLYASFFLYINSLLFT